MPNLEELKKLCYDGNVLKNKAQCNASIINYLILEEMMDIDEAEDLAQKTLNELDLWPNEGSSTSN